MIRVAEALKLIVDNVQPLAAHTVPTEYARSHVLVNDVVADRPLPPFNRVAMDGFAVRSSDFTTADAELKVIGQVQTGVLSELALKPGEAIQVMTGSPCPNGADAVVKVEQSELLGDTVKLHEEKMKPGLNIAAKGEDTAQGETLIRGGTPLSTAGIAICASVGLPVVTVHKKPQVAIISTGTEIIHPSRQPESNQIRDCNSYSLRAMCSGLGLETEFIGIGEDNRDNLRGMIKRGLHADILLLSGGVSMGAYDHIPELLAEQGVEARFHHVNIKPGKPIWFGTSPKGSYVFGLPGNPVSVQTCFRVFVEPLVKKLSGYLPPFHTFLKLPLAEDLSSKTPREHFMPGRWEITDGLTAIKPVHIKGSGDFANFEKSQGLFIFPAEKRQLKAGDLVDFLPWREP